jgi:hypothetical protein
MLLLALACTGPNPARDAIDAGRTPVAVEKAYSCPMHPEVQSDTPGKCSKCGMDLVHRPE